MSDVPITTDPAKLLEKIAQTSSKEEGRCREILASAIFLSAIVPSNDLKPNTLFRSLIGGCGFHGGYPDAWRRRATGDESFQAELAEKAMPIIRAHVIRMQEAWQEARAKEEHSWEEIYEEGRTSGADDFNEDLFDDFKDS